MTQVRAECHLDPEDYPASLFESCCCHFIISPVIDAKLQLMNGCSSLTIRSESVMEIQLVISRLS